ncbi:gfo/Idh/MocA family oxidoreductase, partial [Hungatella sp. SL.1.14]|nr:gfo/Idh/MocA family oxidoreductase [Hungatella sp. SL.1.14]
RLAEEKVLRIGCAPDTFLGGGYQTCRKLIDDGYIGKPISVHAFLARNVWPDGARNDVKLENGGTLPFDMAAYYIHAMVQLFGPVQTVAGFADSYPFELRNP